MAKINDDIKSAAAVCLLNAFHGELNRLVATYRAAALGLSESARPGLAAQLENGTAFMTPLARGTNFDGSLVPHEDLQLWADWHGVLYHGHRGSCGYTTILEALQDERAERIGLYGKVLFVKSEGKWRLPTPAEESV